MTPEERRHLVLEQASDHVNGLWNAHQNSTTVFRQRLLDFYRQYRGIPNRRNYEGNANVFVNETLQACESIVAQDIQTIFSEPNIVRLLPREPSDERKAKIDQEVMRFYLDAMNIKTSIIKQDRQRVKYGSTFAKLCWEAYEGDVTKYNKTEGIVTTRMLKTFKPDMEYIDALDCAFDYRLSDIEDMKWFIIRRRYSWDDIKERERNALYSIEQVKQIQQAASPEAERLGSKKQRFFSSGLNSQDLEALTPYEVLEFWGWVPRWWVDDEISLDNPMSQETVCAVIECVKDSIVLRNEENPYWHKEIPICMAQNVQVDDEGYGLGVCEMVEYLQMELNDKRNQLLDHATEQIAPPLVIHRGAMIDDSQIKLRAFQKIKSDLPGDQAIQPMKLGGNPFENVTMDRVIKDDMRNIPGASNPVQGIASNKDQTAYEISTLQTRGASRINLNTIDFADKFLKRAFSLIFSMIQQYVRTEMVVRIVGAEGIKWEKVTPEDLSIDVDIVVNLATDLDTRIISRNQMIQFVTQIAPFYPRVNIYKMVRKIYELFGFNDADEVVPEPDTERGQNALTVEQEIQVLGLGQNIDVPYYDDHLGKLSALQQFVMQFGQNMTPQVKAAFEDKIRQHQQYLTVLEQARMAQESAGGAPGGNGRTPARPEPSNSRQILREAGRT